MEATKLKAKGELDFWLCGPDETKIGADLPVNVGMVLLQGSGLNAFFSGKVHNGIDYPLAAPGPPHCLAIHRLSAHCQPGQDSVPGSAAVNGAVTGQIRHAGATHSGCPK